MVVQVGAHEARAQRLARKGRDAYISGDVEASIALSEEALDLDPEDDETRVWLAWCLLHRGEFAAAAELLRAVPRAWEHYPASLASGIAAWGLGKPKTAERWYRRALRRSRTQRDTVLVHDLLADLDLGRGKYARGFESLAAALIELDDVAPPRLPRADWRAIRGRTVRLWIDGGFGDVLLFARFLPQFRATGAELVVPAHPSLRGLLAASFQDVAFVGSGEPGGDCWDRLLLAPRDVFGRSLETLPVSPYVAPAPARVEVWRRRLRLSHGVLNVGLIHAARWGTGCANPFEWFAPDRRNVPPAAWAPLGQVPGVRWFSLQVDLYQPEGLRPDDPDGLQLTRLGPDLVDFHDTACVMGLMDLTIAVDSGPANLAGALGVPLWVPLARFGDWRWVGGGDSSPWFPSARVFRQERHGDWTPVIGRMADELATLAAEGRTCRGIDDERA